MGALNLVWGVSLVCDVFVNTYTGTASPRKKQTNRIIHRTLEIILTHLVIFFRRYDGDDQG